MAGEEVVQKSVRHEFSDRWRRHGSEEALRWLFRQAHECEYGMPVIDEAGTRTWTCNGCGDVQTCTRESWERCTETSMRIFSEVRSRNVAEKLPSIGRIVHFILEDGPNKGAHRPAIIVRVWAQPGQERPETAVQLQVFTDGTNDGIQGGASVIWKTSRQYRDPAEEVPGTYHWPEYVAAK